MSIKALLIDYKKPTRLTEQERALRALVGPCLPVPIFSRALEYILEQTTGGSIIGTGGVVMGGSASVATLKGSGGVAMDGSADWSFTEGP